MSDAILVSASGGVVTITLNRPDRLNAFAGDMRERLVAALDAAAARPDARALIITGAGRAFCAGGDVRHMAEAKARGVGFDAVRPLLEAARGAIEGLTALPFPTLAAINGVAAGAGLNLALACDLRLASDQATFTESFVKVGLHPDWGGTYHLPRLVGVSRALELCWLGDPIDAAEALRIGLVNRVVPHARLLEETAALAARLVAQPHACVRLAKQALAAAPARTLAECLDAEADAQAACWASADVAEGLAAFVEKRAPRFTSADAIVTPPSRAARTFE